MYALISFMAVPPFHRGTGSTLSRPRDASARLAPVNAAISGAVELAVDRRGIDLLWLFRVRGDGSRVLRAARRLCPRLALAVGAKDSVAQRHVHHFRIARIHGEPIDRPGGQTAHRAPPSEAIGAELQPLAGAGVEEDPAHPRRD